MSARYKVEAADTNNVWHKTHYGAFATYTEALKERDRNAYSRVMANYGGGWEEVDGHCADILNRLGTDDRLDAIVSRGREIVEQARRDAE
jgi:arylsulfatase A-like enzyme